MTIIERKQLAAHQRRVGPNTVGYYGVLQPFADALKLILKETVIPSQSNKVLFYLAPVSTLVFSLLGWGIIPFGQGLALSDFSLGILYTFALSSLGVYGVLLAGWSANSKYALFIFYFIAILAETSRTPFDLQEAESELVAGFFTEHSSVPFVFFFLGEYSSI
ncbi:PREDICTED: uncharacterized protein LOC104820711, partial [Tarenaya hassleriana]|uniref:uncharacterized protein LOC104820711 n=1 Tax=Tarenaya hassleriana TaxID=28532 RepID=UPI0008FCF619